MMKLFAFAMSAVMALSLVSGGVSGEMDWNFAQDPEESEPLILGGNPATWGPALDDEDGENVQIPTPFTDYASMDEASAAAGFALTAPESVDGYSRSTIQVFDSTAEPMIEVIYSDDAGTNAIHIRKAAGSGDISGDYNQYAEANTVAVGEVQVTMKGENGQVSLATWTDGGYTFSIGVRTESGISGETMVDLAAAVQ